MQEISVEKNADVNIPNTEPSRTNEARPLSHDQSQQVAATTPTYSDVASGRSNVDVRRSNVDVQRSEYVTRSRTPSAEQPTHIQVN